MTGGSLAGVPRRPALLLLAGLWLPATDGASALLALAVGALVDRAAGRIGPAEAPWPARRRAAVRGR